jgi:hypothetical protein
VLWLFLGEWLCVCDCDCVCLCLVLTLSSSLSLKQLRELSLAASPGGRIVGPDRWGDGGREMRERDERKKVEMISGIKLFYRMRRDRNEGNEEGRKEEREGGREGRRWSGDECSWRRIRDGEKRRGDKKRGQEEGTRRGDKKRRQEEGTRRGDAQF